MKYHRATEQRVMDCSVKMRKRSLNKYMNTSRDTCPLYIYELVLPIIIAVNPYRHTIKELQLLRRRVLYNTTIYLRYAARELLERAIGMSGDDERQTCTTTNPGSILQVRRIWLCRCRWWSGRVGSTLHQPIEVDGLSYFGSFSNPWDC